jgi:hypothetical protein
METRQSTNIYRKSESVAGRRDDVEMIHLVQFNGNEQFEQKEAVALTPLLDLGQTTPATHKKETKNTSAIVLHALVLHYIALASKITSIFSPRHTE